jgi:regulatory protein
MVRFADDGGEEADERLAPVTPLFGPRGSGADTTRMAASAAADELPPDRAGGWDRTWTSDLGLSREADETEVVGHADADEARDAAEKQLLRKLRSKPLSIAEARAVLATHELDDGLAASIIDHACRRGYLDDSSLAEHLIHVAVDRKGQGRTAIAMALQKRRIPRDVVDAALAGLPDDDGDRALEFARTKARQLDRVEQDVALRRLVGQLSRRGYAGSVAMEAARRALDEHRGARGVRFS